jgi:hypothetical protein
MPLVVCLWYEVEQRAVGVARNRLIREQFQLQASLQFSAALSLPAIGGAFDQFVQNLAGGDHASFSGPGVVSAVENHDCTILGANVTTSIDFDIKMVVGRANRARNLTEGEEKMDPETNANVQTIVDRYISSLRDRRTQYAVTERFAKNPSEASRAKIEHDFTSWYFGFKSGVQLLNEKAMVPALDTVLITALEKFEQGIAA